MAGWRDTEGRTSHERARQRDATERARLLDTVRYRPLAALKWLAGFALVLLLVSALLGGLK